MKLSTLRYLTTIVDCGSYSKAAEALYVTQPALSQAIQRLEQEIGMPVFEHNKKTQLTKAGEIIVADARRMLELEDHMINRLNALSRGETATLRLGAAPSYQRFFLMRIVSLFRKERPDVELEVVDGFTNTLIEEVENKKLDAAIVMDPLPQMLSVHEIYQEEIFLALPPNHPAIAHLPRASDGRPVAELADSALSFIRNKALILKIGKLCHGSAVRGAGKAGFRPNITLYCKSTENANNLVFHDTGLAFIPETTMRLSSPAQQPCYCHIGKNRLMRKLYVACAFGAEENPDVQKLIDIATSLKWSADDM